MSTGLCCQLNSCHRKKTYKKTLDKLLLSSVCLETWRKGIKKAEEEDEKEEDEDEKEDEEEDEEEGIKKRTCWKGYRRGRGR